MASRLQELERKIFLLERILRSLPGNIFWKDVDNVFQGCNDRNAMVVGYGLPDTIVGKRNKDIFEDKDFAECLDANDRLVLQTGKELILEEPGPNYKNDNYDVWLSTKTPLKNDHGEVIGLLGNAISLSDRKMQEDRLQKALQSAEAANNAKDAFLSNLGHDIRTPLSGMLGVLEELKHVVAKTPQTNALLDLLEESAQSFLCFFNTVLEAVDMASLGVDHVQEDHFDLEQLVRNCVHIFKSSARAKQIHLTMQVEDNLGPVRVGNKHISLRILMNLIGNAIKYTDVGSVEVSIAEHADGGVLVTVKDTGIGIPQSSYDEIFDRFTRLSSATSGKYPGSGMGLYLVKEYVNFLAGSIKVESEVGKGTSFFVHLPFSVGDIKSISSQTASIHSGKGRSTNSDMDLIDQSFIKPKVSENASVNVLVVEDNNIAGMALECMLVRHGCQVRLVMDGAQALDAMAGELYDLIFLDLGLPDISGADVINQAMDTIPGFDPSVIVVLSGHVTPSMRQDFFTLGVDKVCVKPMVKQELESILAKYSKQPS